MTDLKEGVKEAWSTQASSQEEYGEQEEAPPPLERLPSTLEERKAVLDDKGEKPSILIGNSDVPFYPQVRDEKGSSSRSASAAQVKWRLMNRQNTSKGWFQHEHGPEFSLDKDDIVKVMRWGEKYVLLGPAAPEKDRIKAGVENLPRSLNDESGTQAANVLKKMTSQALATCTIDDATAWAKTPRNTDVKRAAKKQRVDEVPR